MSQDPITPSSYEEDRATGRPQRIWRWQVIRELGHGGQGTVYLAEDMRLRRRVALKILNRDRLGGEMGLRRFQREAEITSKLDHPAICAVSDVGEVAEFA